MEYCGGRGEAPVCSVFLDATRERRSLTADAARPPRVVLSRWRLRGSLRVARIRCFSPRRVECVAVAASRRWVLHDGGLLGVVVSASFDFYCSMVTLDVFDDYRSVGCRWVLW